MSYRQEPPVQRSRQLSLGRHLHSPRSFFEISCKNHSDRFLRVREKSGSLCYRVDSGATSLWLLSLHLWERKLFVSDNVTVVTRSMRLALCFSSLFGHLS